MMSFFHVLLFHVICVVSVQAVDTLIGCQPHPSPHVIDEKLSKGTEVVIFQNIKNITISGTDLHFSVTKQSGNNYAITVNEPYVYETLQSSRIQVQFTCVELSGAEVSVELLFIIQNVQDIPPDFGDKTYFHFNISENSAYGTEVGRLVVNAIDGDGNNVVSFNFTTIGTPFAIEWPLQNTPNRYKTGVISLIKPQLLDFETKQEYDLTVTATIRDTHLSSTATVHITVTDVDDMPPRFNNGDGYVKSISEKIYNHHEVIQLLATDQDTGPSRSQDIRYGLLKVFPDTTQFQVANTTGEVYVNGNLDRETCASYLLLIKAYQADKPELRMDITTLNITVTDVDDNPPVLSQTHYNVRIPENTPSNVSVLTITATDADEGPNSEFHYHIKSEGNQGGFTIDPATGILRVNNGSVLDREMHPKWTLQVFAASILNNSIKSHDAEVIVDLLDENDNSPKFTSTFYIFTVNKTISISSTIGIVKANDTDKGDNGMVVYQLVGDESQRFNISDTGTIEAVKALDSNYEPWYRFTVIASDQAPEPNRRKTSVQVTVHVNDVNVNTPQFINIIKSISVQEDIQIGSEVLLLQADDQDPTDNLTFILVHEQDFRLQTVDNRSATILINNALDRERTPEGYNLTLKVTDSLHTSTATLSVIIEDVNDNAPIFNPATYSFSVNEGVSNQGIGNVTATDQDKGNNGSVEYTLLPPWNGNFSIAQTGQIKVKSALDRESLVANSGQISLLVLAKDKGTPPLMTSATVTIHVGDVNDHAPHFKEKELSITINEGQMIMRHIEAYDEDDGRNQAIHYFIGNHNISTVEIKNNTLRSNTSLTYGVYEVEVIAYNTVPYTVSGLKNGTMTVYIYVKDINNHRPHFNRSSYEFSLPENFNVGHLVNRSIVWIHADDADETSEFNTVTYSVVEKDSYFDIDPLTATLRLIKPLDFEKAKYVHFKVMATDGDPNHQETVNVNVTILDVNDNAPVFSLDIYKCSVEEKRIRLLNCSTNIHATDNDTVGNNGKLTYSIEGPIKDIFSINASTGELRPTSPLDADAGPSLYAIKIKAVDGGSPPLSGTAVVEVTVTNVNDNTPVIHGPNHITIPENLPINTTVGSLYATDVDINDNLTFTLSTTVIDDSIRTSRTTKTPVVNGNDNAVFRLNVRQTENPGSVEIILNKALDRESISRFNLTVAVSDSVHSSSFKLEVSIDDINDNPPVFSAATYNFTVDEEAPQKEIGIVNATDIDMNENGRLRYTVLPPWESYFNITNTGQIKTVLALDRESLPSRSKDKISLIIMAKDEGTFPLMATATVTVSVKDINDHAPHFANTSENISINEGQNFTFQLQARDEDEGINGQIHYNISYTNATFLEVEDHTLISKHQMKFGVYKVEIKASNPVSYTAQVQKPQNDTLMVYIHVQDINNHSPKFENTPYAISLHENYDVGRIVNASIKARDDDETSEYNTVSYSVADKDGYFDIDPRTALLRLIKPLDHAKEPHIRFQVKASDGDISHDVSVNVSVTVTDVNDHAPVFSSAVYNCTIMENDTSPITCLPPISATDEDSGENGKINYSIEGFAQHIFNINNTNGVIYPFSPLDYDAGVHNYVLTVLATDNGTPQMTGSTVIDISIEDKNDNSPVIHGPRQFSIPENASLGTTLGVMFVTDADADNNLVFTLSDNTDFHIESDIGELSTARKFDYENNDRLIRVNVSVYDGQHTTVFPITVAITNVNDNSPIFVNSSLTPTISEDMENPSFYIQATDDDADSSLIYTITSKTSTYIHIDSTSGLVTIDGSINAVDNGTITFSVSVTDGKHVVPANVRVNVIDVNDNAPRFTNSTYTFHVKEEIDHIFVGKVMATDEDPGDNGKLRYNILTPWDNVFSVNETGHIEVKSKLDREALISDQITMSVTARDLGTPSLMSIAIVLVHVQDVNDHAPKFQENAMNISIDEGRLVNYQIQAYDEDEGTNHEIYYVIGSKNISRVEIQNNTLRSKAPLTYGVYEVDIIAHNTVPYTVPGLKNGTMTVYIYVQDINNNSPNFDQKSYTFSIHDDFGVGRLVNQSFSPIHAHDADETPEYSTVTYSISNDNGYFEIDPRTATLRLIKSLDYAKEALIDFQVTADDGDKSHQVSVNVSVDVVDANNHTPMFSSELYNCSVEENVTSAIVCRSSINATDGDRGTNGEIHYSIEGQMKSIFTIDNTNGVIRPLLPLDYDTGPRRYILFVQANDNGNPKRTSSAVVEVIVKDKNDNIPVIHGPSYFTIPENSPVNTTIGTVFATDEDALDELTFSITDNTDFHIQSDTGILLSGRRFDYEKQSDRLIHVNVSVSDGQHTTVFPITVVITNVNDNSPVFVNSSLTHTISEDMDDLSFYIQATDDDMDSVLIYSIPSHGHSINIENESGLVTIYGPLNAQDNGTITFNVNVTDGKHPVSATARVQVIDVNDNAPLFENETYTFSVAEEDDNAVVGNVKANDDDQGENGKVMYDILPPWKGNFSIDETGRIVIKSKLDRETLTSDQIILPVRARDLGIPSLMSIAIVQVHVMDVNDHTPYFRDHVMNISIAEGQNFSFSLKAYDDDEGNNGEVYYQIGHHNTTSMHLENDELRSTTPLEYGVYEIEVIAYNPVPYSETGLRNGTLIVFIRVKDINNNSPVFTNTSYLFSLPEDFTVGGLVTKCNIHAHDVDETPEYNTVTYSIPNDNGYFEIDPRNATLRLIKSLDYEIMPHINFKVVADDGDITHQVSVDVSVTVLDVNNHAPMFSSALYNCTVYENDTSPITCEIPVNATDADSGFNGDVHYLLDGWEIFTMDYNNGTIRPSVLLDYDMGIHSYILTVIAIDQGVPAKTGSAVVEISVQDKNDNSPVIHGPSQFSFPESAPVNTAFGTIFATDADSIDNLKFSLTNSRDFHIQPDTGILSTARIFDYEKEYDRLIHANVSVNDGQYTTHFPISVAITNVNDNSPVFVNVTLTPTISEDIKNPSFYIQATDKDMDAVLQYNISTDSRISISGSSGLVTIHGQVISSDIIKFDVSVYDGIHLTTAGVMVHVTDVNDHAPRFENSTYIFDVDEELENAMVGIVNAHDADIDQQNKYMFYMIPTLWSSNFTINTTSGAIRTVGALDRENPSVINDQLDIIVMVMDEGVPPLTGTALVVVNINDVNDHRPMFVQSSVQYTISERQCPSRFHNLEIIDKDEGENQETRFQILHGGDIVKLDNDFLKCKNTPITPGFYNITVKATNVKPLVGTHVEGDIQTIDLHVQDVNDHDPIFDNNMYSLDLLENQTLGELFFTPEINATDADPSAEYSTITYAIIQGNGSSYFDIDPNMGRLWLKSPLDYEQEEFLTLTISASDGHVNVLDNKLHSATACVYIYVLDINDNKPTFTSDFKTCSVRENVTGIFNCVVKATDADAGDTERLTYSLLNSSQIFDVSTHTGEISVKSSKHLDYDQGQRLFDIHVVALDGGSPQLTGSTVVSIDVVNVNDEEPVFTNETYVFEIHEEEKSPYYIGHVSATDLDEHPYDRLTFSLVGFNDMYIDNTTGDLFTSVVLDYEDQNQRVITDTVIVSDGAHRKTASVTVSVTNINDNKPQFNQTIYRADVRENTATGHVVTQVHAFDLDNLSSLQYRLEGGNDGCGAFKINTTSGEIYVFSQSCLDYERQHQYLLVVVVSDGGTPDLSSQTLIEINVIDEDDIAPIFITDTTFGVAKENEPIGTSVLQVAVYDPDTPFENVTLSVNNTRFVFDNRTLVTNSVLDAEDVHSYNLIISVSDGVVGHIRSQMIQVNVSDVNDNTPAFNSTSYNGVISQNAKNGSYVLTVGASDADISNSGFTFYLSGGEGNFMIDSYTGVVRTVVNEHVHFCVNCTYMMDVHVIDYGEPPKSNSTQLLIRIDTSNHNAPVFTDTLYIVNLTEHQTYNDSVISVSATDADCVLPGPCGPAGSVEYSIVSGGHIHFRIDKVTGQIYLNGTLDYTKGHNYILQVEARDQADDFKTATTDVRVDVIDINERPHFVKNVTSICSVENITAGDLVGIVTATDPDHASPYMFDKLTYTLLNENDKFHVVPLTGKIYALENVSSSVIQNVVLRLVVKDYGGLNDTTTLRLSTGTKGKPVFDKSSSYIHVRLPEDVSVPVEVTDVNTTTEDLGTISYHLTHQGPNSKGFRIDNETGVIEATEPLDRETSPNIILTVTAANSKGECSSLVDIEVLDVNDQPPIFQTSHAAVTVLESAPVGTCIETVSVMDKDSDPQLTFIILDVNSASPFGIESNNGSLSACVFIASSLDYENVTHFNLMIQVDDGIFNDTMDLAVAVQDVNDNYPFFSTQTFYKSITEDISVGTSFYQLRAMDADHLDDGKLQYSLTNDYYGQFSIRSDEGVGYVILNRHLDREVNSSYVLEVKVMDTANHTNSTSLNITILDVNDNKPEFLNDTYNVTVNEGPDSDLLTIRTEADDIDEGSNAELEYSIISQDFGHHFVIGNTTGVISVLTSLNREDTSIYTLVIQAADQGETRLSGTATVFVNVEDINDCVPEFQQTSYSASVMEGSPSGTSVIHLTAVDKDVLPINRNISYLILDDQNLFDVHDNGVLTLTHEVVLGNHPTPYHIQIEATDGEYNTTVNVTVSVTDVNDHDPVFNETFYLFSVPENDEFPHPPSVLVGSVSATDEDPEKNGEVSYSILSTEVPVFIISRENGSIITNGTLDRDRCVNSRYTFTVIATDNGNATRTGLVEVTVTISDINDNWPEFTSDHYDGNIIENSDVGTEVNIHPAILASDIDAGNNGTDGILFYLSTDSPFEINSTNGRIFVKNKELDREKQETYNLEVIAIDQLGAGNNKSVPLTITLADANDEPPVFTHNISVFTINENAKSSDLVGSIHTSDADVGGNVSTRYNIVSGGDGRFYIDPISGEIIVTGGLDQEQKDNYTLTIRATDGVNSAKAEVDVIIEDANDNSPIFPSNPVVINVTESDANISRIYTFTAYDKDLGENAVLTYFINQSDADASTFYVTEDGILSTIQPIDRETVDSYSFLVHVHDNGTPSLSASVTVLCQVLDSNDNSPIFYDSNGNETTEYKTSILEKSPVGSPVFFPYVRDEDLGLNSAVHFQLLGAKRDLFQCNQKNGVVTIAKRIEINSLLDGRHDNETATYVGIILTVMATDQGQPSKSTNLTLHVTVEQISDENPVFDHELYQFNVSESTLSGSYIGDVKASMPNVSNYHLTYSIVTHSSLLILEKDQGRITLNNTLDREESDLHTFVVQVTDGKTPERTAFTMVNIRVIDVNDNAPHFNKPSYEYTITEGTYTMSTFGNVSATDRDIGRNAVIKYSLVNYTGEIFDVDISTGALVVNGTIDREENTEYTLLLQAEDQGVPALNTTVVVRVKIEDINDNSPKFLHSNYTCFVLENASYEQICNVSATDEDQGYNGTVVYSFQDSNIPFYINPIDGTISKTGTTDFETKNIYNITIEAHDLGSPELSSSVSLVIVIGDVPDTPPHFPRRVYDISTSSFTPLHTVLLNVTAGDGDVIYTIPDGVDDAQNTFCIDHVSGDIYLCRAMVPKQSTYVLTVEAEDANLTDTTVVVIHVRNEPASFNKSNYTADVMENHVGVLLDLNTTEELTGIPVHYTLVSVQPKDNGFIVNATTGEIYCSNELDRERVKTYTLVVSAEKVRNSDRSKRSTGESLGQVTVIVRVGDMNDNPPQFPPDTKLLYRVPSSLRVTSKVAELQAIDPDENSIVTYHLENSDELPFILRESDKAAKVLLKNHLERPSYNLTVSATDQDGYSANVTLTVITIPDTNRLTYVIPMSPQEFEKQEKKLIANLSSVLGVNVTTDGYDTHVDPSKTGLRIIARNMTTGRLLTTQELSSLISSKFADIYKLFHCTGESCYVHSKSIMTAPEIALLVIAVLIFVTGILVIFIGNHLWKQFHKAREEEMKMWELESFRSNAGSHIDNGTVNPNITNIETSFADLNNSGSVSSGLAANKKRTVLYESQELTMNFDNDAFCLEPPVTNGADSGVENDSSSNSSNTDEIEPPSPDVFRGTGSLGQTEGPGRPDQGTSKSTEHALALPSQPSQASLDKNQRTVLQIDMDTGDTSDDNIDTDYEEKLSINSTDSKSIRSSDPIVTSAQISEQVSSTVEIPETNVDNADIDPSVADDNIEEEMMTSF